MEKTTTVTRPNLNAADGIPRDEGGRRITYPPGYSPDSAARGTQKEEQPIPDTTINEGNEKPLDPHLNAESVSTPSTPPSMTEDNPEFSGASSDTPNDAIEAPSNEPHTPTLLADESSGDNRDALTELSNDGTKEEAPNPAQSGENHTHSSESISHVSDGATDNTDSSDMQTSGIEAESGSPDSVSNFDQVTPGSEAVVTEMKNQTVDSDNNSYHSESISIPADFGDDAESSTNETVTTPSESIHPLNDQDVQQTVIDESFKNGTITNANESVHPLNNGATEETVISDVSDDGTITTVDESIQPPNNQADHEIVTSEILDDVSTTTTDEPIQPSNDQVDHKSLSSEISEDTVEDQGKQESAVAGEFVHSFGDLENHSTHVSAEKERDGLYEVPENVFSGIPTNLNPVPVGSIPPLEIDSGDHEQGILPNSFPLIAALLYFFVVKRRKRSTKCCCCDSFFETRPATRLSAFQGSSSPSNLIGLASTLDQIRQDIENYRSDQNLVDHELGATSRQILESVHAIALESPSGPPTARRIDPSAETYSHNYLTSYSTLMCSKSSSITTF